MGALEQRRAIECRLTPDRALRTIEEAAAFLAKRGLLTRMPDCALPSLFGACHEEPARQGGRGFDLWPKTRWIWSFHLASQSGVVQTKLHRGKTLYLSTEAAQVFNPLVRNELASAEGDDARLLEHLGRHGESMASDLELELGWDKKRLQRARNRLERVGAVLSDGLVFTDASTWHFAPLRRWDQVFPDAGAADVSVEDAVVAGVRAAVVAPEADVRSWFSWAVPAGVLDSLVASGRLARPKPGWLALQP
ncbi:MAG: hypothetical protein E6J29_03390 [Chloroflexi bacterium]|nr:MAG: hypothetical protein E6J29_03390 [Chloroflexota bacterium]